MIDSLAQLAAGDIRSGFLEYRERFQEITDRARLRFETRDWHSAHVDSIERLNLYKQVVDQVVGYLRARLGPRQVDRTLWVEIKGSYTGFAGCCGDFELAETFFNSITRRIFTTIGVDAAIEFVDRDFDSPPPEARQSLLRRYFNSDGTAAIIRHVLKDTAFQAPFRNLEEDIFKTASELERQASSRWGSPDIDSIELLEPVFFRDQGAYLVGRVLCAGRAMPLVLSLRHPEGGILVDAMLVSDDQVSIVFSFTRSYFHVAVDCPYELVAFLKTIMPWKRVAELYISIGFNKHGKTEFYRDLMRHLASSEDRFVVAPGERGMVMVVFTLPSYDMVFKLIKDKFGDPKRTSRQEVMKRYDLVFLRDRAGRLVDAQEFEHLTFDRRRFDEALLAELMEAASGTVTVTGDQVVIKHLYLERRLVPLDLYIRQASEPQAASAVLDYGQCIKDLAAANIFPGDVLLKNFGVTRHGRVVFYDYDELCLVTDCHFRRIPQSRDFSDDFEADPWFYVSKNDIFPEEFRTFLGLAGELREIFIAQHSDLFDTPYWRDLQKRHKAGEIIDILPYRADERLT